jgi:TolB protein
MRHILGLLFTTIMLFSADATIEVIKKADSIASIAIEDATASFDTRESRLFFRNIVSDLNVLSLFNVQREHNTNNFNSETVLTQNRVFDYVLRYRLRTDDSNNIFVDMKLLYGESELMSKSYKTSSEKLLVFVSHTLAYDINEKMGAPAVNWMKKKVIFSKLTSPGRSEIVISDYTLTYQHTMIKGALNIFPQWANNTQNAFYYTSLAGGTPTLYKMYVNNGAKERIVSSDGMLVCSDVSADGKKLLLTMAPSGQPDIYLYDVTTKRKKRLTTYSGIDVNAQFMEDNTIAFVSNRLGYPNIFSKKLSGGAVEQMVYYGKSNAACSAHNEYVVYKSRESANEFSRNTFNLHLISTKTDFIRRLTATGINEFPRFSASGDSILFIKNYKQQSSIGVIRLEQNKSFLFPLKIGKLQSIDW